MKFTVAQGDQVLTFSVPLDEVQVLAVQAGTVAGDDLADTGGSRGPVMLVIAAILGTAIILAPTLRRRRG